VKNGVPWDVANELDPEERMAFVVIVAEFDGAKYDWQAGEWRKRG